MEREGGHLGNGQESQAEADKVLSRLIKQNSEKRAEKIPDLIWERKKSKIAYFILDRLIVREKNEGKGYAVAKWPAAGQYSEKSR